ncbi:PUA-like domain-containing protein [Kockovaella imperatae]|uniref:PUA-like domain-containing protein n=1 Tax=Kockovaella imperatae TaxID=4999 RepID=A0A1Y1USV3_9TREE|nr:PUA-like domain-containing protein [Kockovaella imperatae]ORX41032.1 PUA-like domain-containing protein [Kockovaella imperatae]
MVEKQEPRGGRHQPDASLALRFINVHEMAGEAATLSYEDQRLQNIRDNEALLLSLGLSSPGARIAPENPKPPLKKAPFTTLRKSLSVKRKLEAEDQDDSSRTSAKRTTTGMGDSPAESPASGDGNLRRSGRTPGRKVDYTGDGSSIGSPSSVRSSTIAGSRTGSSTLVDDDEFIHDKEEDEDAKDMARQRNAQRMGVRTQDPKQFGHIPGVEVGRWWASRMDCSTDAIHAPTVAGISGNEEDGAWSVALSGGYPDDVDLGEAFTYTGSGGRDLKGTKNNPKNLRTAPQTSDQSFSNPKNAALKRSAETRQPVRVIRGFKLDSPYAPLGGYRYDGLYTVEKAWMAAGLTRGVVGGKSRALMVCRYAFKRVPGQPPLTLRRDEDPTELEEGSHE